MERTDKKFSEQHLFDEDDHHQLDSKESGDVLRCGATTTQSFIYYSVFRITINYYPDC